MKFYSAEKDAFFAGELRARYESAGSWPADAQEVSEAVFEEYSGRPPLGKARAVGPDGLPMWVEVPARGVGDLLSDIDQAAGNARERFVSPGYLVDQEYKRAEEAARSFADAGYPASDVPSAVSSWASAKSWTAQQAADDIIATADYWYGAIDQIREIRLAGKAAVQAATADQREAVAQQYIDQLNTLAVS
ncbi:hypothetical protein EZI54_04065 [Marinobacter halodurans]|uniref:Phage tail protein n=1 Tax=Marinobacter halodurans TaxID=2528979 RepID=A0ABY1ZSY5_9GAMM|nr:hypothetical protein [Marinobacter halodurans]TBW58568.1 hypothetical protein EZI54_04065 [Marinobacter halodurans]